VHAGSQRITKINNGYLVYELLREPRTLVATLASCEITVVGVENAVLEGTQHVAVCVGLRVCIHSF